MPLVVLACRATNKRTRNEQWLRDMLKVGQGLEVAEEMEAGRREADAPRAYGSAYARAARNGCVVREWGHTVILRLLAGHICTQYCCPSVNSGAGAGHCEKTLLVQCTV